WHFRRPGRRCFARWIVSPTCLPGRVRRLHEHPNPSHMTIRCTPGSRARYACVVLPVVLAMSAACGDTTDPSTLSFATVTAAVAYTCGLTAGGAGYCWGFNADGSIGDGSKDNRPTPTRVSTTARLESISAGGGHTCGVANNGAALCWGSNLWGQIGDGS